MPTGFIRDDLQIKCLILYAAARAAMPLEQDGLQELTMVDEGVDYFRFSQCLSQLVSTAHFTLKDEVYTITAKGIKNSAATADSLPLSVREKVDAAAEEYRRRALRRQQVSARVLRRDNGTYTVELHLSDDVDTLMELQVMAATKQQAESIAKRFQTAPEAAYQEIMTVLSNDVK